MKAFRFFRPGALCVLVSVFTSCLSAPVQKTAEKPPVPTIIMSGGVMGEPSLVSFFLENNGGADPAKVKRFLYRRRKG